MPLRVIVMGVCGCGKSTVGTLLARQVGGSFLDADDLHPASNVAKMSAGIPLTDQDRDPWLHEVGRRLLSSEQPIVIACSALKRAYRDIIRSAAPDARFLHLQGSPELLAQRMAARPGHFMPPSLLDSQFATLEELAPDEAGQTFEISETPDSIVNQAFGWLTKR